MTNSIKIIDILRNYHDVKEIKRLVVMELMLYFDRVHRGVIWENNRYSEKKNYSLEFKNIFKDLPRMLYVANLENKKQQNDSAKPDEIKTVKVVLNSPKIKRKKPGVKAVSEIDLVVVKYLIIHKFYKSENPYSVESQFTGITDYLEKIADLEKLNPKSFKNSFYKIVKEDIYRYCKSKPKLVKQLLVSNSFQKYPKCLEFITQFEVEAN